MQIQIQTSSQTPIYSQIVLQVREAVAKGRLAVDERLPSVRELSKDLVVNPNTIARAYRELERDGVLNTRPGLGVFVATITNDRTKSSRKRRIVDLLDELLTEAVLLGFKKDEVLATVNDRVKQFHWNREGENE